MECECGAISTVIVENEDGTVTLKCDQCYYNPKFTPDEISQALKKIETQARIASRKETDMPYVCDKINRCPGWEKSMPEIDAAGDLARAHGNKYAGDAFRFCPWCGKERWWNQESTKIREAVAKHGYVPIGTP